MFGITRLTHQGVVSEFRFLIVLNLDFSFLMHLPGFENPDLAPDAGLSGQGRRRLDEEVAPLLAWQILFFDFYFSLIV
jgi:hypothetical protein